MSNSNVVGAVGALANLVSRPDLNGKVGSVEDFTDGKFTFRMIDTEMHTTKSIRVGEKNVGFFNIKPRFAGRPHSSLDDLQAGRLSCIWSIIPIAEGTTSVKGSLVIGFPCCIAGVKSAPDANGVYHPQSILKFDSPFAIQQSDDEVVKSRVPPEFAWVEVNDISFVDNPGNAVCCVSGSIIFRRCHFRSTEAAACVLCPNVTFENCVFESLCGSGVLVTDRGASANILHCVVHNCGIGIEVRTRASVSVHASRIGPTKMAGVVGYIKAEKISVKTSLVTNTADSGIMVQDSCKAIIADVSISGCAWAGVVLQKCPGSVSLSHVRVTGCNQGFMAQEGHCPDVTVINCNFSRNRLHGIFICQDCIGKVTLIQNACEENRHSPVLNDSGNRCQVTLDGQHFPNNGILKTLSPAVQQRVFEAGCEGDRRANPLTTQRARAAAGLEVGISACACCQAPEDPDNKFLKCSRCLSVVYCDTDCQLRHWKAGHKTECVARVKYPSATDKTRDVRKI